MTNRLSPIVNALNALTEALTAVHTDILKEANDQRKELIALRERMAATHTDFIELGMIVEEGAKALTGVADVVNDHAIIISDTLDGSIYDVPEVDYEDFVGYCAECGDIVSVHDEYSKDEHGNLVHNECIEPEEDEADEPEQMSMDISVGDEVVAENA